MNSSPFKVLLFSTGHVDAYDDRGHALDDLTGYAPDVVPKILEVAHKNTRFHDVSSQKDIDREAFVARAQTYSRSRLVDQPERRP